MKNIRLFYLAVPYLLCMIFLNAKEAAGETKDVQVQFRVKWDGKVIPDITHVSGFRRITEAIKHRTGEDANAMRFSPGLTQYKPIILKRPRTFDQEFERWVNKVWKLGNSLGMEMSLRDYRKDITIELYDEETGATLMAFRIYRCWPSEYIPITDLNADSDEAAMEVLILHHEGWERDLSVP